MIENSRSAKGARWASFPRHSSSFLRALGQRLLQDGTPPRPRRSPAARTLHIQGNTLDILFSFFFFCKNGRCWRRLLRVPWTARRSNQSTLKEINPEYSLEGLMLKLKLQYFGHLMQRADSLEKTLMLGKIEDKRRREWQRMR